MTGHFFGIFLEEKFDLFLGYFLEDFFGFFLEKFLKFFLGIREYIRASFVHFLGENFQIFFGLRKVEKRLKIEKLS